MYTADIRGKGNCIPKESLVAMLCIGYLIRKEVYLCRNYKKKQCLRNLRSLLQLCLKFTHCFLQVDKKLVKMLGDAPKMQYAGSNVNLTITTDCLTLIIMESGEVSSDVNMWW